jgi:hypothetical protein
MNVQIRNTDTMVIRGNKTLFQSFQMGSGLTTGFSFDSLPLTSPILCLGYAILSLVLVKA